MKNNKKKLSVGIAVFFGILLFLYLSLSFYYRSRFLFGSVINGISYAGKTVEQVEQDIDEKIQAYTLTIQGRDGVSATIKARDIGYHYVKDDQLSRLKEAQNPFSWPLALFNSTDLAMEVTTAYDSRLLENVINALPFLTRRLTKPRKTLILLMKTMRATSSGRKRKTA